MIRTLLVALRPAARHCGPLLLALATLPGAGPAAAGADTLDQQRQAYRAARAAWSAGDRATFARLSDALVDYPLHPYLEFEHLRGAAYGTARDRIDRFLAALGDMPLANRLRARLLREFYAERRWQAFAEYHADSVRTDALDCQYQEARYHLGERAAAIAEGLRLWNVERSRPAECDPLFALLRREGALSEPIVWQRFAKAVRAGQLHLAGYLQQMVHSAAGQSLARRYLALYRDPGLLADYRLLPEADPEVDRLLELALIRAARTDAAAALRHWRHYDAAREFEAAARARIASAIARGLYEQDRPELFAEVVARHADLLDDAFHEWLLRRRVAAGDWSALAAAIDSLPEALRGEPEWRYWRARSAMLTGRERTAVEAALGELSTQRSFYGFLASDWLNRDYQMAQRPAAPDEAALEALASRPALLRVRELLHHGQELDAAREWWRATRGLSEAEWALAGHLAHRWGWHYQAILAMVRASRWDDLDVRFPLVHRDQFAAHAGRNALPMPLALAVARQESAFRADAISPAGARGLMQLMPATANEVARRHGIAYRAQHQLFDAGVNIHLGTRYYRDMLDRFHDNRILATAAYNAGPGRVRQWLARSGGRLPFDAWIEAIPFLETRNYVQNVLAFSAIYAHRLGSRERILSPREREQPL
ncbi:MAG: transglycosylase SLT domain-containing protein [Pseudomonadota bacterium]